MKIIDIVDVDFTNYRKPSMFIIFPYCSFKCDKENGCQLCQNSSLAHEPIIEFGIDEIIERYKRNPLTKAIVCGGLEPFDSKIDLVYFVKEVRAAGIEDDIVIYTGYTENELARNLVHSAVCCYPNIIIKYGRFRPNEESHYDKILGVKLVSSNQYAKKVN